MARDYAQMVCAAIPDTSTLFSGMVDDVIPRSTDWIRALKSRHPYNTMSDWKLLTEMRLSITTCYCNASLNACSFDEMWLSFLMKEIFKKQWEPDTKSWIKIG